MIRISDLQAGGGQGRDLNWADNERLKESGFALEGKIVNGVKTADGIIINVDSAKALNTVAGHEITHVLEGTEFYDDFHRLMVQFAKTRGEYDSRMADLKQLYKDGTDLEAELVADIVGDYIFTDEAFVRLLQTGKRGLFQTVYDEIKYLRRMATAGSKEAKALIKAEKLFEKLYRQPMEARADSKADTNGQNTRKTEYSYDGLPDDAFYNENYSYIYGYNFLTAQKKMTVVDSLPTLQELQTDGRIDREKVLNAGYRNILENGGTKDGDTYSIINTYTKKPLQIGKNSITHGLGATSINAKRTNARLAAVIGELCKNAIPICCLPNTHNVRGTYGMAVLVNSSVNGKDMSMIAIITVEQQNGNVQSVDFVDVAHAVSGRLVRDKEKENRSAQGTPPGTKSEWATRFSSIRIAQFLEIVNMTHQGFLSDDVISKLGEERRGPQKTLFSLSPMPEVSTGSENTDASATPESVPVEEAPDEEPSKDLQPQEQSDEQPTEQTDEHPTENDKGLVIKRRALELYEESKNMQKGVKVSNDLSYLEFISQLPLSDFQKDVLYRSVVGSKQTNEYGYTRYFGTETVNGRQRRTTYYYDGRNGILYDNGYNRMDYSQMKGLELAPKPSMSDYDRYSGYDEFKFAQNDPYRYEFLQANGVSWQEYTEQKEVFDWAWNNPKQEAMSKVIAGDIPAYKSIHDDLASLHSPRDADGKVTVERKDKVKAYISDSNLTDIQKKILYKLEYPSYDEDNWEIAEYIVALPDASTQEKKDILTTLGFKVDSKGKITWD